MFETFNIISYTFHTYTNLATNELLSIRRRTGVRYRLFFISWKSHKWVKNKIRLFVGWPARNADKDCGSIWSEAIRLARSLHNIIQYKLWLILFADGLKKNACFLYNNSECETFLNEDVFRVEGPWQADYNMLASTKINTRRIQEKPSLKF